MSLDRWFGFCPRCGAVRDRFRSIARVEGSPDVEVLRCGVCDQVWDSDDAGRWTTLYRLQWGYHYPASKPRIIHLPAKDSWSLWVAPVWDDGLVRSRAPMVYLYPTFEDAREGFVRLCRLLSA